MMWHELFVALALVLVMEGMLPFLSPDRVRNTLKRIVLLDNKQLRFVGLTSMLIGVLLLYLVN